MVLMRLVEWLTTGVEGIFEASKDFKLSALNYDVPGQVMMADDIRYRILEIQKYYDSKSKYLYKVKVEQY